MVGQQITNAEVFVLIELVKVHGKNWNKILPLMHARHMLTKYDASWTPTKINDNLRKVWKRITNSNHWIHQPYETPKMRINPRDSPEVVRQKEAKWAEEHQKIRTEHEKAREDIKEIEARELMEASDSPIKESDEVGQQLKDKGEKRKEERMQRLREREELAKAEVEREKAHQEILRQNSQALQNVVGMTREFMDVFKELVELKKRKLSQ